MHLVEEWEAEPSLSHAIERQRFLDSAKSFAIVTAESPRVMPSASVQKVPTFFINCSCDFLLVPSSTPVLPCYSARSYISLLVGSTRSFCYIVIEIICIFSRIRSDCVPNLG
jgi:hypothetical protein